MVVWCLLGPKQPLTFGMRGLVSLGVVSLRNHGKENVLVFKNLLILSATGRRFPNFFQLNNKLE